ncbi:MAG TPA: SpoIIIAH-like family protein [Syntrophomonadaceae bacterium]|nr:SpoIIIAH-like family protein [Syntrophomonadaceae bacterium]
MMVINMRNRRFWMGAGLAVLGLILVLTIAQRTRLPAQQNAQVSGSQQKLETSIINKLEEKRGQKGFFAEYRMERESLRGQQMELLGKILNDTGTDRVAREAASARLVKITEDMEKEMKMESLVKSRGFSDCVIIDEAEATTLVVAASSLSSQQEAELRQLIGKPAKKSASKVYITRIEP